MNVATERKAPPARLACQRLLEDRHHSKSADSLGQRVISLTADAEAAQDERQQQPAQIPEPRTYRAPPFAIRRKARFTPGLRVGVFGMFSLEQLRRSSWLSRPLRCGGKNAPLSVSLQHIPAARVQ
jgi:hypothetical protein